MNYDRKALKLEAKALIREARPKAWVVTLIFVLLAFVLPKVVEGVFNPMWELIPELLEDMADMLRRGQEPDNYWMLATAGQVVGSGMLVLFLSVLLSLFTTVMSYGYRGYALRVFRRQKAGVGAVFSGVPLAGRAIGTGIMTYIFTFLWTLLIELVAGAVIGLGSWLFTGVLGLEWLTGLLGCVVGIVSFVLCLLVALRYCLAPYFVMSDQDKGVFASIAAGKEAMRGNYIKKLVLDLSFLGWGALVVLIIYLVALLGGVVVLLTAGSPWLLEMEEASHYMMTDLQAAEFALRSVADLVRSVMVPMGFVMLAAWLISLPLNLWLMAYQHVADAGFFLTVTGQVLLVNDEAENVLFAAAPVPDAPQPQEPRFEVPEAPAEPDVPQEPETPEAPPAEPAGPDAPQGPETPAEPDEFQAPEAPEAPEAPDTPQE